MKPLIKTAFFCLLVTAGFAQDINIGKKLVLESSVLNEARRIWVYTPESTATDDTAGKRYPVIYLLDGDSHFYSTVGMVQQLSQANGNAVIPEMIVVGIENTNRLRDLTPGLGKESAHPFMRFLSEELMPYIEQRYRTAPFRVLAGHSMGGLTAIDALVHYPALFNAVIAIDPSMWYNSRRHLAGVIQRLKAMPRDNRRLFIGIANTIPKGMTLQKASFDRSENTLHIRSILSLDSILHRSNYGPGYRAKFYEAETHTSVPLIASYDGLRFIFDFYPLHPAGRYFLDTTEIAAYELKKHYNHVTAKMGYPVTAPYSFVNFLAYAALSQKHFEKARALFKMNIESYPYNAAGYEGYSDYLIATADTQHAITSLKQALAMNESATLKARLAALLANSGKSSTAVNLSDYAGAYMLENYNIQIVLEVRGGRLWSRVPGQSDSELYPVSPTTFLVKDKPGYTVSFQMQDGKPTCFVSVQPNGTFKAVMKR